MSTSTILVLQLYRRLLCAFSATVYSFPLHKEQIRHVEALHKMGYLERQKLGDPELKIDRWAYRRTAAGSEAIGA